MASPDSPPRPNNPRNPASPALPAIPIPTYPTNADILVDPLPTYESEGLDDALILADLIFVSARARDWIHDLMARSAQAHAMGEEYDTTTYSPDHYIGRPITVTLDNYAELMRLTPDGFAVEVLELADEGDGNDDQG